MSEDELKLLSEAGRRAAEYVEHAGEMPVYPGAPALAALERLDEPLPEGPSDPEETLLLLDEVGSPATAVSNGPRYFGFVIGATLERWRLGARRRRVRTVGAGGRQTPAPRRRSRARRQLDDRGHKWLNTPYDGAVAICRDASALSEALNADNRVVLNQVLGTLPDGRDLPAFLEGVQAGGLIWFEASKWWGRPAFRLSVSSWRTTDGDVETAIEEVCRHLPGA